MDKMQMAWVLQIKAKKNAVILNDRGIYCTDPAIANTAFFLKNVVEAFNRHFAPEIFVKEKIEDEKIVQNKENKIFCISKEPHLRLHYLYHYVVYQHFLSAVNFYCDICHRPSRGAKRRNFCISDTGNCISLMSDEEGKNDLKRKSQMVTIKLRLKRSKYGAKKQQNLQKFYFEKRHISC